MKGGLPLILMEGGLPLILQTHHITQDAFPAKSLILSSINTLENSLLNDSSGKLFSFFLILNITQGQKCKVVRMTQKLVCLFSLK